MKNSLAVLMIATVFCGCKQRSSNSDTKTRYDANVITNHGLTVGSIQDQNGAVTAISCDLLNEFDKTKKEAWGKEAAEVKKIIGSNSHCKFLMVSKNGPQFLTPAELGAFKKLCEPICYDHFTNTSSGLREALCSSMMTDVFSVKAFGHYEASMTEDAETVISTCFASYGAR